MECYELFRAKTDFRWFQWEIKPNKSLEEELTRMVFRHGNITERVTLISSQYYQSITKYLYNEKLQGVRLNLNSVAKADEGYYSCVGCNFLGCSTLSARLTVTGDAGMSHLFCTSLLFYCVISLYFCVLSFLYCLIVLSHITSTSFYLVLPLFYCVPIHSFVIDLLFI